VAFGETFASLAPFFKGKKVGGVEQRNKKHKRRKK